jgi:crossover junction endodeoxyribonuclease RuvC
VTTIFAIDPGLNGAFAVMCEGKILAVENLPRFEKSLDLHELTRLVKDEYPTQRGIIEHVFAMPRQGVSSTFVFGSAYGACRGVLAACGLPYTLVTPRKWKQFFHLNGKNKPASRELAIRLHPECAFQLRRQGDHDKAEAVLLAHYEHENNLRKGDEEV